jgi:drug/metabolite transporter (DMT)-like permease
VKAPAQTGKIDLVATAGCLGTLCCWSIGPIFIAYLTDFVDSWTQNVLRYSVACLFWLPFLAYLNLRGRFDRRTWWRAIAPAAANVVMQSLWAMAYYYIGPAFLVLLSKTSIVWVAGFSLIFFADERPLVRSARFWAGLVLSIIGVFGVLYFKEGFEAAGTQIGIIIALLTAMMWAIYIVSAKVAFHDIDSRSSFGVITIYTVVGLWVCALLFGHPAKALHIGLRPWAAVVFSGITAIALGHVFFYAAIRRIGATIPTLVILAQPFVVFSVSSVVFRERLSLLQLVFGTLLLLGSATAVWAQQHLRPRAARDAAARESA